MKHGELPPHSSLHHSEVTPEYKLSQTPLYQSGSQSGTGKTTSKFEPLPTEKPGNFTLTAIT